MKTIKDLEHTSEIPENGSVVTLGNFDGVHLGHASLINRTIELSRIYKKPSVIVTYYPNPSKVIGKREDLKDILSPDIKRNIFNNFGIDYLLNIHFTVEFSKITAYDFLKQILLQKLKARYIIIGYDHYFGKGKEGNYDFLKRYSDEFHYEVEKMGQVYLGDIPISSTNIRKCIESGDVEQANRMLDRNFYLRGMVVKGFQRGKSIGFPTANLKIESENNIVPGQGVYACLVVIDNQLYKGMVNIGKNPTFSNTQLSVEGHIFNFNGDLYGKMLEFHFIKKHREEKKFSSIGELVEQLRKDEFDIKKLLIDY